MDERPRSFPRWLAAAAVAVGIAGGTYGIASAASGSGSSTATGPSAPAFAAPGTTAHEDAEKAVTGAAAAQAQAAAVAAVGGGTAGDVTTDCSGRGYEVTVTKADGSVVEVHLDSSFEAVQGPANRDGIGGAPPIAGGSA
jgi:hypothetical protein